jgi:hypothetical protein
MSIASSFKLSTCFATVGILRALHSLKLPKVARSDGRIKRRKSVMAKDLEYDLFA